MNKRKYKKCIKNLLIKTEEMVKRDIDFMLEMHERWEKRKKELEIEDAINTIREIKPYWEKKSKNTIQKIK